MGYRHKSNYNFEKPEKKQGKNRNYIKEMNFACEQSVARNPFYIDDVTGGTWCIPHAVATKIYKLLYWVPKGPKTPKTSEILLPWPRKYGKFTSVTLSTAMTSL